MGLVVAPDFAHTAVIVDSDDAVRQRLVPMLQEALAAAEAVLIVVGEDVARVVRAEIGDTGGRFEWAQPSAFRRRLGFGYERMRRHLADRHAAGQRLHLVAESDVTTDGHADAPVDRVAAFLCYEAMCNEVYAGYGCPVTCLWDSRRHPTLVIDGVRSVHRHELVETGRIPSPGYITPGEYLGRRSQIPLRRPPSWTDLDLTLVDAGELGPLRDTVRTWAVTRGFTVRAAEDVIGAVTEVVANGLVHGGAPARARAWAQAGTLIVQVDDPGGQPLPPAAGYRPPPASSSGGRGMWLARQLADTVTVHSGAGLTSVRLHFPHGVTHNDLPD